ncbi:DUF7503 family protein [Haladaptatus salinisoli]|nr:hypothetical protein [Haladaptatus salinisoli]
MSENTAQAYLAEHPRMIGVLFAICLAASAAGNAAAAAGGANPGP